MKAQNTYREGEVSKWNEGNFKNLRLHEAQEMINFSKIHPLKKTNGTWNYETWISGIDILYGEGHSKYKDKEIENIEKIKKIITDVVMYKPPFKVIVNSGMGGKSHGFKINYEAWENLRKLIEIFEQKVKYFNDQHGLSTGNVDEDWEGL